MSGRKVIGNTPMIEINYEYKGKKNKIYAKLEYYNLTGSVKDRVAYYIIKNAKEKGILVGPGRGSAAGSLVSYCLNITTIDPINYNLMFELHFLIPSSYF